VSHYLNTTTRINVNDEDTEPFLTLCHGENDWGIVYVHPTRDASIALRAVADALDAAWAKVPTTEPESWRMTPDMERAG